MTTPCTPDPPQIHAAPCRSPSTPELAPTTLLPLLSCTQTWRLTTQHGRTGLAHRIRESCRLAFIRDHRLCTCNTENSHEFLFQVPDTDKEPGLLHCHPISDGRVELLNLAQPVLFLIHMPTTDSPRPSRPNILRNVPAAPPPSNARTATPSASKFLLRRDASCNNATRSL
jgi:hypothetical protein